MTNLADRYLAEKRELRSVGTLTVYESVVEKHIKPEFKNLTIGEADSPERLQAYVRRVQKKHGAGAAKSVRTVLSGMFGMAVRNGAIPRNPVRELEGIRKKGKVGSDAIPLEDVPSFLDAVEGCTFLRERDEVDLLRFLLGVGFRAGEALGLCWDMVDFQNGKISVERISKRQPGKGMFLQDHPKTEKSRRTISAPLFIMDMLKRRRSTVIATPQGLVFPTPDGAIMDVNLLDRHLRKVRKGLGFSYITSHSFRKTVATMLADAGMSSMDIADYLGHSKAEITERVYIQRNRKSSEAAALIDAAYSGAAS
ncbi:tyrosine-type recombinase/integrase [Bifidobacterium scaligerum]|nr:site-specific integrase [Bifidobacterium scaligerum]